MRSGRSDRYELLAVIGHGASGVVHLALDHAQRRYVAAKVLQHVHADELSRLRFLNEQRISVDHPHVLATLDWVQSPEHALLVLELADAGSLEDVLALNEHLPPSFVEHVAAQALEGLRALHDARIIHRDLKPGNVMLRRDGHGVTVKIGDLGAAVGEGRPRLTQEFSVVGTVGYVAPEVLLGAPHDERSDLWALGRTVGALARRSDPPVSRRVTELIERLTLDDPTDRPASAAEALRLLDTAIDDSPLTLPVVPDRVERAVRADARRRRRRTAVRAVAAVAMVALLVAGVGALRPEPEPAWRRERREAAERPGIRYLTFADPTRQVLRKNMAVELPTSRIYARGDIEVRLDTDPLPTVVSMVESVGDSLKSRDVDGWKVSTVEVDQPPLIYWLARDDRHAVVNVRSASLSPVSNEELDEEVMRFIRELRWDGRAPMVSDRYVHYPRIPLPEWVITHDGVDLAGYDRRSIGWNGLPGTRTTVLGRPAVVNQSNLMWQESSTTVVSITFDRPSAGVVATGRWLDEWRRLAESLRPSTSALYDDLPPDLPPGTEVVLTAAPELLGRPVTTSEVVGGNGRTTSRFQSASPGAIGTLGLGLARLDPAAVGVHVWLEDTQPANLDGVPECAMYIPYPALGAPAATVELESHCDS